MEANKAAALARRQQKLTAAVPAQPLRQLAPQPWAATAASGAAPAAPAITQQEVYQPAPGRPECPYGASCYRRSATHFAECNHPTAHTH